MAVKVSRRIDRTHKVEAWVGDEERLKRLIRLLEGLTARPPSVAGPDDGGASTEGIEIIPSREFEMSVVESGGITLKGDPTSVLAEMDRSAVTGIDLEVTLVHDALEFDSVAIRFDRSKGVTLSTRGEAALVEDVHQRAVEEINRGVPWWEPIRGGALFAVVVVLVGVRLAFWFLSSPEAVDPEASAWVRWALGIGASLLFAALPGIAADGIAKRVLPGFEVVAPGEAGRGARALGLVGTVVLAAVGILGNLLFG